VKKLFKLVLWVAVLGVAAYAGARAFLVDFVHVTHNDMAPTLAQGDLFALYRHATPELGDIVVCDHPNHPEGPIAGRLVGLPGDTLAIRRGMLVRNGRQLDTDVPTPAKVRLLDRARGRELTLRRRREFLDDDVWAVAVQDTRQPLEMQERRVREGWFLLADNRSWGTDSRHLGEFDPASCRGVAIFLLTAGAGNGDLDALADERRWSRLR
jgi:signal peptidase I